MAYNVMVEVKSGVFVPLDISKSNLFERTSRFKETRYSLEEIDRFTSIFETQNALIKHMIEAEILDARTFNKPLSIRVAKRSGRPKKVMYDFLYQKDKKYLDNPKSLIRDISRMQLYGELNFCLEYVTHFLNFYDCNDIAPEIRAFINISLNHGITDRRLYLSDENGDMPIVRMTKQLIYKYHHNYGAIVYDYDNLKYRNLHDIIAFCEHYHNKKLKDESNTRNNGKVRTLKKEHEQITFDEEK